MLKLMLHSSFAFHVIHISHFRGDRYRLLLLSPSVQLVLLSASSKTAVAVVHVVPESTTWGRAT